MLNLARLNKFTLQKIISVFFLSVILSNSISCQSSNTLLDDKPIKISRLIGFKVSTEKLDEFVETKIQELNIPGVSLAIINNGEVVYHKTAGFANLQNSLPVNQNTIFEGASISKPVFAFFVMTFVDDGLLDLDTPLYKYLPYPDIAHDERYKKITARTVLSHRTGLPNWREDEEDKKLKLKFDPGTEYSYSGEGYQYLAKVLKNLIGTNWQGLEEEFQRRVGQPLGMKHTLFIQNAYSRQNKAEPYDENNNWINWKESYWFNKNDSVFVAPTSIHSEAIDFSKWMIAIMNEKGLSKENFRSFLTKGERVPENNVGKQYNALGLPKITIPILGGFYAHDGNNEGFSTGFVLKKKKKWGFVYFTNSEYGNDFGLELLKFLII